MKLLCGSRKYAGVTARLSLAALALCVASSIAVAAGTNAGGGGKSYVSRSGGVAKGGVPTGNNTTPITFRALVPDGSALHQTWDGDAVKWYAFLIEPGKTYVVEALDPYTDNDNGSVNGLGIFDSDGTTSPPPETNVDCTQSGTAPGLANFAVRCIVRAYTPDFTALTTRLVYVRVDAWVNTAFQIRVRESTVYGRWTTNGYDFHVEVQNTTSQSTCVQLIFYPNSGMTYSAGSWSGQLGFSELTIPPFGAAKVVRPNGTLVGTDNKGALRVGACPGAVNLIPGGIHVNTLGFNPTINQFLPYSTSQPNNSSGSSF